MKACQFESSPTFLVEPLSLKQEFEFPPLFDSFLDVAVSDFPDAQCPAPKTCIDHDRSIDLSFPSLNEEFFSNKELKNQQAVHFFSKHDPFLAGGLYKLNGEDCLLWDFEQNHLAFF